MAFVPDSDQPSGATSRFVPDSPIPVAKVEAAPSLKDSFISLMAPGGIARMIGAASKSFDKAAYDAGAKVSDMVATSRLPAPLAAGLGTAANVGIQALPMLGGGEVAKVASPAFDSTSRWLMKTAIKPLAQDLERGRVPSAIQTMLERGYSPTESGVAAMRAKVGEYMDQVKQAIGPSTARVDLLGAANNLNQLKAKYGAGTLGEEKIAEINKVLQSLYEHPSVKGGYSMSVQDALAMRQANDKTLGSAAYGLGLKPDAERDALKGINAALREQIATTVPATVEPMGNAAELLNAIKVSQRRALIEGNKNPLSLGVSIASAAHDPMAALGLWANSSAAAKAALARAAYSGQEAIPRTVGQIAGAGIGAHTGSPPGALQKILDDLQRNQAQ